MHIGLSAIMVVRNEENKIRRCLESLRWVDEIVVLDQSSVDGTAGICREYADKVFVVEPKGFCEPDRAEALAKAAREWVLYIDADEVVSLELAAEIKSLLSAGPEYESYQIPRKNIFLGKWIKGSAWHPGYSLRLFKKGSVKFLNEIHTNPMPLKKVGYLNNALIHYACEDLKEYIDKTERYASILAGQAYAGGERISAKNFIWRLYVLPAVYFFHRLILKAGIRDGFQGVLIASLTYRTIFMKNAKLLKMQKERR